MATENFSVTGDWQKFVDVGEEFIATLPAPSPFPIELAVSDTDVPPEDILGHRLMYSDGLPKLNRGDVGPGYVYIRARGASRSTLVVLTSWAPE